MLSTLLAEVGLKPSASWILAEGADASAMSRSIPLDIALDGAILAYAQNGERLRAMANSGRETELDIGEVFRTA